MSSQKSTVPQMKRKTKQYDGTGRRETQSEGNAT